MPRKSFEELACRNIDCLLDYAANRFDMSEGDAIYAKNELLHLFEIPVPIETTALTDYEIYSVIGDLFDYAVRKKLYEETDRQLFEGRVMGILLPRPSEIVDRFDNIARYDGAMSAMKWLQGIEEDALYLRRPDLDRNIRWQYNAERGTIDVTVNLAKPEKTAEEVERAKLAKTGYPKCALCYENLGFYGNAAMSARQNLRFIPIELDGEDWFLQFSPYEYFDEHVIAVSKEHRPMHLDVSAFRRMLDFVDLFPDYFVGSNAPLPIVGGSILAHDHYQGGGKVLPMLSAPSRKFFVSAEFPSVNVSILDWYNSVLRFESKDATQLVNCAEKFRTAWDNYSDESVNILAKTDAQHNTVTPTAHINSDGEYAISLILRNNRTDEKHPFGIFHPTEDMHNIKQESIGIIEAMGLFILPGRLARETDAIKNILMGASPLNFAELADAKHPLHKHLGMIAQLAADFGTKLSDGKASEAITNYINVACEKILDCTAVFKNTLDGQAAFEKFVNSVIDAH